MKQFGFLFFLLLNLAKPGRAQHNVIPSADLLAGSTIRAEKQQAVWYEINGTARRELATLTTTIEPHYQGDKIRIVQEMTPMGAPGPSKIDTTIVFQETLAPVYHSSYDGQRELVLNFNGRNVSGFSKKQPEQTRTRIQDEVTTPYFNASFYPFLLRFLPLKTGYHAILPVYYFTPGQYGLLAARIIEVNETDWTAPTGEKIPCYAVEVIDDMAPKARTMYYISKQDRTRLQSDMTMGQLHIRVERR